MYHIDTSAKPEEINSEQSSDNTVFIAKSFSYYVLAEKAIDGGTSVPTKPGNQDTTQTGDKDTTSLWVAIMLISGGALTMFGFTKKRKKTTDK